MTFRGCMSLALCAAAFVALAWLPCGAATIIGNVSSWSQSGQDVTFNIADGSKLRLSVLAADLIRFRFAPSGTFTTNISKAVVKTDWPAASYTAQEISGTVRVTTAELIVDVQKTPCVVSIRDAQGNLIVADDPSRRIQWDTSYTRVYKTTRSGESYLGLGWRPGGGIRRNGTSFTMRNKPTYDDPTLFYGGVPLWYGINSGKAYAIFFDDTSWGTINVGAESSSYMYFNNLGGQVDYYFFYGPAISKILDRYTDLTGRPFMPPKWACGYQQCRWSYTPQQEVLNIASEFRSRDIPCDAIYLDIDYMNAGLQLTFSPSRFPSPSTMCTTLRNQGFKVIANIGPWLLYQSSLYNEAASGGYLIKKADGGILIGWHDYIYFVMGAATGNVAWVDFTKTSARTWYAGKHTSFLANGIDGIWNDLNEPDELGSAWPTTAKHNYDGANVDHNKVSPQYCLMQTMFSYDVLKSQYPTKRPFVLSRGAYAGIQRYSAVWSGDNTSEWTNDLKRNIPMGLSMSLCGQPHNGHDIGGFYGYPTFDVKPSAELFARWMEWGVFTAFCRAHHHGNGIQTTEYPHVEPWSFDTTTTNICKNYITLRYQLMPYLYSLFYQAHTSGAPIHRPTVYDFPNDASTLTQDYDFMFGPFMLISPVYTAGATTRNVYLPSGTGWSDWWTDTRYNGGQTIIASAPLDRMPIYVRDGAIIPMGPAMEYAGQVTMTELNLKCWPSTSTSSFTMFEDDGISWNYQTGTYALTTYTMSMPTDTLTLDIAARLGAYAPSARSYLVEIHRWTAANARVSLNGANLDRYSSLSALRAAVSGFFHDSAANILYVRFPDTGAHMVLIASSDTVGPIISELRATDIGATGQVTFRATCADSGAGMDRVEFFIDGAYKTVVTGDQPSGYYYFNWTQPSAGQYWVGALAYDRVGNHTWADIPVTAAASLKDVKSQPDGTFVSLLSKKPVTAAFASGDPAMKARYVYIEDSDRATGIRVRTDDATAAQGSGLWVVGTVRTVTLGAKSQIEKYVDATGASGKILVDGAMAVPGPYAMTCGSVCATNRGLLVTVCGNVTAIGTCDGYDYFYVDDGSRIEPTHDLLAPPGCPAAFSGIRVYSPLPTGLAVGSFVLVTGVSSCESPTNFSEVNRVIRVDSVGRAQILR